MADKRFIAIAGNIGSGKTTLTQLLSERYGWEPHFEVVTENPYLADFYGDMPRWSLQLQVFFLSKRFQAHQKIARSGASAIQDRSIYEDAHIFARALHDSGKMERRDYQNYLDLYQTMLEFLQPPDLVVYVRRTIPALQERIKLRGREYEGNIPVDYLQQLNDCYDDWIGSYKLGKVLTVESDPLDLKFRPDDFAYVCRKIEACFEQPDLFFRC
jgi:deoxyadenosine/deoxycytidine kinase